MKHVTALTSTPGAATTGSTSSGFLRAAKLLSRDCVSAAPHVTAAGGATVQFWIFTGARCVVRGLVVQPAPFPCIQTSTQLPIPNDSLILPLSRSRTGSAPRYESGNLYEGSRSPSQFHIMASVCACWATVCARVLGYFARVLVYVPHFFRGRKKNTLNPKKKARWQIFWDVVQVQRFKH